MSLATILIVVGAGTLGILSGWIVPAIFKSARPFGLGGDVLLCLIVSAVLAWVEWVYILPAMGFQPGWLSIAAAVGDPVALAWICLWLMRKIKS